MGKNKKKPKSFRRKGLRVKLIFDDWFAERQLYRVQGNTNEKKKGLQMLELIEHNFNISKKDKEAFITNRLEEFDQDAMTPTLVPKSMRDGQVKFTRDEQGKIVSPFKSNRKIFEK